MIQLWLPSTPVVPIKPFPAASFDLIKFHKQVKSVGNANNYIYQIVGLFCQRVIPGTMRGLSISKKAQKLEDKFKVFAAEDTDF